MPDMTIKNSDVSGLDQKYVWHPYSAMGKGDPVAVQSAKGVRLRLADGRELVDGMSSWWCAIHGYNHPVLNAALKAQLSDMAHVMFGGLTHEPAVRLAQKLVEITPDPLQSVFFSDSGSVAVEVAMKMAIQYWQSKDLPQKQHFLALRRGYHGDTFGAMSVCDPVTGMHSLFSDALTAQFFVDSPACGYRDTCTDTDLAPMKKCLIENHHKIAAVILEPVVQGAGGMKFYSPEYLEKVRQLCDDYQVLLIADEIATGFGRTGRLFACEHADVSPDIMCVGKALTGGYMTLAATLSSTVISESISAAEPGIFMHGPTFMANPLACAVSLASIDLLLTSNWSERVKSIGKELLAGLAECRKFPSVVDVRVLGAIGVVELGQPVDLQVLQGKFVDEGVWVRPFGQLIYLMPPFIINRKDIQKLTQAVCKIIRSM